MSDQTAHQQSAHQSAQHPCQNCGACCTYYRVSFSWRETHSKHSTHPVPLEYVDEINEIYSRMKGTSGAEARCIALEGTLAHQVSCKIYSNRPTPCRQFNASYENGTHNPKCDQARARIGLNPLTQTSLY